MWISSNSLDGRTALVTGAGRGLGQAIALNLAQAGARGALLGRSGGELDQTAKQVREFGAGVLAIQADVGDPGQLSAAAMQAFIRGQDPDHIGAELHQRFTTAYPEGTLISRNSPPSPC